MDGRARRARRAVLATLSAARVLRPRLPAVADDAPPLTEAAPPPSPQLIGTGTVRIQAGATPTDSPTAALYVTARLVPSNVAPLYVTAGKVPGRLAAARFPAPTFPFDFKLDASNLTPEWAGVAPAEATQDLVDIGAARLGRHCRDARDPEDLVGRGELKKNSAPEPGRWSAADVELQGRGLTGRILTAK